jgi:hypothetical protein
MNLLILRQCYAFPMNMTGSSFIWTPQLEDPSQDRMAPRAEGNASNLIVRLSSGTSLYAGYTQSGK